jgi:membrane protease YdiL (CAAX protease family)
MTNGASSTGRRLPIWGFILLAVGYLAAVQLVPRLTTPDDSKYATYTDTASVVGGLWVTVGVGSLIGLVAVAVLGWWRPVFVEDRRLPRWTWVFPVVMLVAIAAGVSYGNLSDKGYTYTLMLLVGCLFIGLSEELMFRGIGITAFLQAGFTEGKVALWTCVLFGLAHATNIFTEGVGALPQVLVTAVAGYFFYVTRRVSGLLIVSMIIHGLWDFGLFTTTLSTPTSIGGVLFILADIVLAILAIVTIRKVFPRHQQLPTTTRTATA